MEKILSNGLFSTPGPFVLTLPSACHEPTGFSPRTLFTHTHVALLVGWHCSERELCVLTHLILKATL